MGTNLRSDPRLNEIMRLATDGGISIQHVDRGRLDSEPEDIFEGLMKSRRADKAGHIGNWLACIKSRQRPTADVEIGHRSATVCHLVNIARWTGRRLKWDPAKEQFIGDAAANQYLDRERRKGFEVPAKI